VSTLLGSFGLPFLLVLEISKISLLEEDDNVDQYENQDKSESYRVNCMADAFLASVSSISDVILAITLYTTVTKLLSIPRRTIAFISTFACFLQEAFLNPIFKQCFLPVSFEWFYFISFCAFGF
jgi:hypothetical protein